jgi:hypothetical protein|tara:strand:+ start:334 stop:699 length:366 start_codon:yes stop_codon:yes gene_type:complete
MWDKVVILGLVAGMASGAYFGFNKWLTDKENAAKEKAASEVLLQASNATIIELYDRLEKVKQAREVLDGKNREQQEQIKQYLSIFDNHNLTLLSRAKPGMVEKRVNKGTKEVLEELEEITK